MREKNVFKKGGSKIHDDSVYSQTCEKWKLYFYFFFGQLIWLNCSSGNVITRQGS